MRWFEDYQVGQVERFGAYQVTREEVIEFASRFDPQPFHLDDAAAAANPIFGKLAASGWHTCAMVMRMLVDHQLKDGHMSLGSPGVDEIRWLKPVYPGDTLSATSFGGITVFYDPTTQRLLLSGNARRFLGAA